MNTAAASRPLSSKYSAAPDAIEWEEMPSLIRPRLIDAVPAPTMPRQVLRQVAMECNTAWGITMPAQMDNLPQPAAVFREALSGLAVREMNEPDVFQHFFGGVAT